MEEIRSWWEVPCIAHFCSLFRAAFGLTDFEIEDLEDALLIDGSPNEEGSRFLADLHARLLRGLFLTKDIDADNFEPFLSQVLKIRWEEELGKRNPLADSKYRNLSTRQKVEILHSLCDFRLDVDDVADLLKGLEADSLRVEPLGYDSNGNTFWYFYGTRLYKERNQDSLAKEKKEKKKAKKKKLLLKKKKQKGKLKKKKKLVEGSSSEESASGSDSSEDTESSDDDKESPDSETDPLPEWSLVCSTVQEWEELTESFRGSKNRDERALYDTLSVDFVSEISQMIESKEKALQKKLMLEMNPRRTSERIALKASVREEEEKLEEIDRHREKERQAEIKKKEDEEKQKEKQRLMEKRQRERAERARAREERQWLIANGEEIPAEITLNLRKHEDTDTSQEGDTEKLRQRASADGEERDEDLYTGMYKLLDTLKKHSQAWPFLEPVDESYAPQYHEIIEQPMDLSTIEQKLDESKYFSLDEFTADMRLMFENCHEYNGPDSMYTKMANALEAAFNRHLKKHFPDDEDNSDEDFEEELMKKSKKKMKELPKPKKPGHFVDNFVRESGGMNRGSPNPPQLHNMAQAMAPMQPFYSNHLPSMNQMTGRGMMPPNHPSRFPYHPTAHFSPDGRPLYPPQFYQNFNRGMSPYGMPHHPQYNQFAHMASQMARPQGMQGYPNAMMQGHVRFPPNVRENSMDGYKKSELEHPVSPQVSIPAVSTSGEVTPSSETSELNEPDTAKPESQEQRLSEAASGMGPHVRPKSFEQGPPDSRKGPPLSARPVDFGQQLPVGYGNQQLRQRGYFSPRSQVPMQLQARADSYMQRMPVSAGSRMPFSGAPGSYQQNQSRQQMPVLKHIREQNVPPSHEQQANDQSVPRSVKSSADAVTNKHQSPAPTKSTMDQSLAKSSISPPRKHESEEEEVPFPFIIRPGKNKKLEHDGETIRKDSSERQKEKQPVSSSSENELQESDKQTSARKPLGFPVSQLLNDPSDTSSKSPGQETVTRPGGQPSVIKSTAAVTPSPTTHQPRLPEDRSPSSDDSTVGKSLSSRAYPPMASMQSSPSLDRPTLGRGYPGVKPLQNRQNNRKEHSSRVDSGMDASLRNQLADKTEPGRGYPNLETSHNTNREGPLRGYTSVEHSRNPALFKEWSSSVQGCDAARPRSFLEELNGDDFPPPRGYPEFPHSGRSGVDLSNHHLPFTSLLKEMAPPHGAVYSKPREPNRTDSMYGKNYTDRDSLKESFPSGRNQLHSPEVDPRHGDRQHASYEDNLYGNDKRASHAMPPLFRPSNGANQDLSSSGPPKEFGKSSGVAVSSERQLIDLDSVPYRRAMYQSSEGAYNRDALFLASQRGQQPPTQGTPPNIPPTMSQIFPGPPGGQGGPPMMGYSAMLRQHQLFEAAYASHMVRNGEYPMSRVEDGVPSKVPRFS